MAKHSARLSRHPASTVALIVVVAVLAISGATTLIVSQRPDSFSEQKRVQPLALAAVDVDDELVPAHREDPLPDPADVAPVAPAPVVEQAPPPPPGAPAAEAPKVAAPAAAAPPARKPAAPADPPAPVRSLTYYRGMGTWVDIYDYAIRDTMNIPAAVEAMQRHGVKTLYLQTSRWKDANDIVNIGAVNTFLDQAHERNIKVIGWYVPGFGNIDRDIRRSLVVLDHTSGGGNKFDGFAPDIETREEVGGNRDRYNAGVAEYSKRLRAALPNAVLGAIVDDAKNNLRAPERHAGFPWSEIAANYDVVLPMAYWSVTKGRNGGCGAQYDAEAYIREAVALTKSYMGVDKPIHPVGGIADCVTEAETEGYVRAVRDVAIGGSYYDFATIQSSSVPIWGHLAKIK